MTLANPGTNEPFSTATVNANFEALDTDAGATDASLTANASSITSVGARVTTIENNSAKGTVTQYTVASLAALDAISTAVVGDQAVFSAAPSTGIAFEGLKAQAISGSGSTIDWRFTSPIEAATKANLDTFIAAVVAISDLATGFKLGGLAYISGTRALVRFTSTAGAYNYLGATVPIVPTSVAGTGVTVGANGVVSGATGASVSINGIFSGEFDNYLGVVRATVVTTSLLARLRAAGVDASGASDYAVQGIASGAGASTISATSGASTASISTAANLNEHRVSMTLFNPADAEPTFMTSHFVEFSGTSGASGTVGTRHALSTAYDGITYLTGSGNFSGFVGRFYGYNDN